MRDEEDDDREIWLRSAHTERLRERAATWRSAAFVELAGACRMSTDPKVVQAYMEYERHDLLVKLLSEGEV
jgi:hypothetical protein